MKLLFVFSFLFFSCNNSNTAFLFYPLHPYEDDIQVNSNNIHIAYYYVENMPDYAIGIPNLRKVADSIRNKRFSTYLNVNILFYFRTNIIDSNFRESETDILEWHGKDLIYKYIWSDGQVSELIFKDGTIINADGVELEQIR